MRRSYWAVLLLAALTACSAPAPPPPPSAAAPAARRGPDPLAAARAALEGGNVQAAQRFANQALAESPRDPEAHRLASEAEFLAGNYDRALEEAKAAVGVAETPETVFTLAKVQMFADPRGALGTVRSLYRQNPDVGQAIMLADAILLDASARDPRGPGALQAAAEAREVLAEYEAEAMEGQFAGDYQAVLGNSYLLEGDLPRARRALQASLDAGVGMPDRVTDLQNALAWIAFRAGDGAEAERRLDLALGELDKTTQGDAFLFLPKWESYHALRLAMTGKPATADELRRREAVYRHLARRGYVDQLSFRMDRQLYHALFDAWDRKDYGQAFHLLYPRAHPQTVPQPLSSTTSGEQSLQPNCFYRTTVEEPEHEIMSPLFLGRLAERVRRPDLARFWYRRALELEPGNRILGKLLARLPATEAPADLGAPGPEETVRILHRFAEEGWANPLLEGMQVLQRQGVSQAGMEGMLSGSEGVRDVLDRAVQALERGAEFRVTEGAPGLKPGRDESDPEVWGWARAELPLGDGGEPLVLHLDVHVWYLSGLPRTVKP